MVRHTGKDSLLSPIFRYGVLHHFLLLVAAAAVAYVALGLGLHPSPEFGRQVRRWIPVALLFHLPGWVVVEAGLVWVWGARRSSWRELGAMVGGPAVSLGAVSVAAAVTTGNLHSLFIGVAFVVMWFGPTVMASYGPVWAVGFATKHLISVAKDA